MRKEQHPGLTRINRPPVLLPIHPELFHIALKLHGRSQGGEPAVSETDDAFENRVTPAANPDIERALLWFGLNRHILKVVELAVMRDVRLGPQLAQNLDSLFEATAAGLGRYPARHQIARVVAASDGHNHPPV